MKQGNQTVKSEWFIDEPEIQTYTIKTSKNIRLTLRRDS